MKPPTMPSAVRVGAHTYTVERKPAKVLECEGEKRNGDSDVDELKIRIAKRMRRTKQQEILLHEIMHACAYPSEIAGEEELVTIIAPALLQVIKDNPELMEFLTAKK